MWILRNLEDIKKSVIRSASVGALADGASAAVKRNGPIKVAKEMITGATCGTIGAVATEAFRHYFKNQNDIIGLTVGAIASIGTRHVIRTLQTEEEEDNG